MTSIKTLRTQAATSSTDKEAKRETVSLAAPPSWNAMTQEQLRYTLRMMTVYEDMTAVKTCMFIRFTGIEVLKKNRYGWKCRMEINGKQRAVYLHTWEVQSFIHQFDYIDTYEDMGCRLDAVCGLVAVDTHLHGVSFADYLMAEKYYQLYMGDRKDEWLDKLAWPLYVHEDGKHSGEDGHEDDKEWTLAPEERLGVFLWFSYVKSVLSRNFKHFFKVSSEGGREPMSLIDQYNVQLRALTDGDVTKEEKVLQLDCWRTLTELDAKAREAAELENLRKKQK